MLRPLLRPVVNHLMPDWPPLPPEQRSTIAEDALEHVAGTVARAPVVFRAGITGLGVAFRAAALVRGLGRDFGRQDRAGRERFVAWWSGLSAPTRSFERLVRSLTVVAAYEHPLTKRAMGLESDTDRRARKRRERLVGEGVQQRADAAR